jgi:serine/threonine protein kinase
VAGQAAADGTPFGRYRLVELLGGGGMGDVWRAYDTATDRIVAIKVLHPHLSEDEEFQRRFRREAHAAARLNNPHVIPIHNYGEIDGRLYVDMRLVEGRDLGTVLADGPLEPGRAVRIIEQVANALHAAHQVGLLHRDVKPSNILLDRDDFAYLIDFGIARALDETRMTKSGSTIGTFHYIAPERLADGVEEDARADIYSLACVLYECLTGGPPFAGDMARLVTAHLNTPPPRPSINQPNVPARVDQVIATGMAKDPDQRYATTVELADAARDAITVPLRRPEPSAAVYPSTQLDQLTAGPIHNQDTQLAATGAAPVWPPPPRAPQRPTYMPPPAATGSRRKWLIALLVVVLIAAAGVGGVLLRNVLSSKPTGSELVLTGATDPGANSFMPPAAPPPPTNTQPPPTLQPHGNGPVVTQPLPGDRIGLYGGTLDNAACDRDQMISFLGSHPTQASAIVEALNSDPTLFWSGGNRLTPADIPTYLRELTPMLLRLDTRVTNHGFDGTHPTTLQSVLQTGTAVFVDAHGVPRARCYCGNPLTAPVALTDPPKPVGTPWPGYNPAALAEVQPSTTTITTFVLVDVVTGHAFNRPAGTTGTNDTPNNQPVPPPVPAPTPPTPGQGNQPEIDGTYLWHTLTNSCMAPGADATVTFTHQGNTLSMVTPGDTYTGPLNTDGSFALSGQHGSIRGVLATEGGRTVIRNGIWENTGSGANFCRATFEATKQ